MCARGVLSQIHDRGNMILADEFVPIPPIAIDLMVLPVACITIDKCSGGTAIKVISWFEQLRLVEIRAFAGGLGVR